MNGLFKQSDVAPQNISIGKIQHFPDETLPVLFNIKIIKPLR